MSEVKNVPEICFAGFTDAWEQRKLGDLGTITTGNTPSTSISDYYSDDGIMWVTPTDINENITFESARKLSELGQQVARVVSKNTILVTCIASIGKNTMLGNIGSFNQQINGLTPNEKKYDPYFLLTESALWSAQMKKSAAAGTMQIVNRTEFFELKTWLPNLNEQRKIGLFFRCLDNLITLHQQKYDRLVALKKAMLEKMFPQNGSNVPEVRFAGFTGPWKQRKLGDLVQFSKGTGYSKADLTEDGIPIILYGRLYTKYETVISDVDTFAIAKSGSVYSRGGEVIVPASGETAEDISIASVVEKSGVLLGGDLNIITPSADLDSAFLAISISNGKPHDDMAKMAQGKSVVHLHNTDLKQIDLTYPSHEEQTQISGFFRGIDHLIALQQCRHESLKRVKAALLQKMFV